MLVVNMLGAPDFIEQLAMGHHEAGMANQYAQQPVFDRRYMHFITGVKYFTLIWLQAPKSLLKLSAPVTAPKFRLHCSLSA
jgi:hypothetical protein